MDHHQRGPQFEGWRYPFNSHTHTTTSARAPPGFGGYPAAVTAAADTNEYSPAAATLATMGTAGQSVAHFSPVAFPPGVAEASPVAAASPPRNHQPAATAPRQEGRLSRSNSFDVVHAMNSEDNTTDNNAHKTNDQEVKSEDNDNDKEDHGDGITFDFEKGYYLDKDGNRATDQKYPKRFGTVAQRRVGKKKLSDKLWMEGYQKLKAYREAHDGQNPPNGHRSYAWLSDQRSQYFMFQEWNDTSTVVSAERRKALQELRSPFFDQKRIDLLKELGVTLKPFKELKAERWQASYQQLVEFKQGKGHLNIPKDTHRELYLFLKNQRGQLRPYQKLMQSEAGRKKMAKEKDDSIPTKAERLEKIDALGIVWNKNDAEFEANFEALMKYKKEHGDCDVPERSKLLTPDGVALGNWVKKQREQYRAILKGKSEDVRGFSRERMARLIDAGFRWGPWSKVPVLPKRCKAWVPTAKTQTTQTDGSNLGAKECGTQTEDSALQDDNLKPKAKRGGAKTKPAKKSAADKKPSAAARTSLSKRKTPTKKAPAPTSSTKASGTKRKTLTSTGTTTASSNLTTTAQQSPAKKKKTDTGTVVAVASSFVLCLSARRQVL